MIIFLGKVYKRWFIWNSLCLVNLQHIETEVVAKQSNTTFEPFENLKWVALFEELWIRNNESFSGGTIGVEQPRRSFHLIFFLNWWIWEKLNGHLKFCRYYLFLFQLHLQLLVKFDLWVKSWVWTFSCFWSITETYIYTV